MGTWSVTALLLLGWLLNCGGGASAQPVPPTNAAVFPKNWMFWPQGPVERDSDAPIDHVELSLLLGDVGLVPDRFLEANIASSQVPGIVQRVHSFHTQHRAKFRRLAVDCARLSREARQVEARVAAKELPPEAAVGARSMHEMRTLDRSRLLEELFRDATEPLAEEERSALISSIVKEAERWRGREGRYPDNGASVEANSSAQNRQEAREALRECLHEAWERAIRHEVDSDNEKGIKLKPASPAPDPE